MQKLPLKNLDHVQPKLDLAWVGAVSLSHDAVMRQWRRNLSDSSEIGWANLFYIVHNDLTTLDNAHKLSRCPVHVRTQFGKSTNWTQLFVEIKLIKGGGIRSYSIPSCSAIPLYKSSIHWKFIKCGRRFPWDLKTQQTKTFIDRKYEDIIRLLFQSRKNVLVVLTFRLTHAIGVWTPKTIGRASRAFRNINVHIYFCLQKRESLEKLIALYLRVGLIMKLIAQTTRTRMLVLERDTMNQQGYYYWTAKGKSKPNLERNTMNQQSAESSSPHQFWGLSNRSKQPLGFDCLDRGSQDESGALLHHSDRRSVWFGFAPVSLPVALCARPDHEVSLLRVVKTTGCLGRTARYYTYTHVSKFVHDGHRRSAPERQQATARQQWPES